MQLMSKVAVGVGVVVVGLGTWYLASGRSGDRQPMQPTVTETPPHRAEPIRAPGRPVPAVAEGSRTAVRAPVAPSAQRHALLDAGIPSTMPAATTTRPAEGLADAVVAPLTAATRPALADIGASTTKPADAGAPSPLAPPMEAIAGGPATAGQKPPVPGAAGAASAKPGEATAGVASKQHVVQAGDTFSRLAVKYFGHAKYSDLIQNANPDKDPLRLRPGMKLVIPPGPQPAAGSEVTASPVPAAVPQPTPSPGRTPTNAAKPTGTWSPAKLPDPEPAAADRAYTVQPGDNWDKLAKRFLGKAEWPVLYEHNKERLRGNPRNLRPGLVIELPEGANLAALNEPATKPASR